MFLQSRFVISSSSYHLRYCIRLGLTPTRKIRECALKKLYIDSEIFRSEEESTIKTMKLGGIHDLQGNQNSGEIESLARFAILEHNKQQVFESYVFWSRISTEQGY